MSKKNANIIILAWPETPVRKANGPYDLVFKMFGLVSSDRYRAGHAALILIDEIGNVEYFDFGRYITPEGYGRVRGVNTDHELQFDIKAKLGPDGSIENLEEIIKYTANHPETHGEGRMYASVCRLINHKKAKDFIAAMQKQVHVEYGPFVKNGSNCSRFVADAMVYSTTSKRVKRRLKYQWTLTSSTIGNVIYGTDQGEWYTVENEQICRFKTRSYKGERDTIKIFTNKVESIGDSAKIGNLLEPELPHGIDLNGNWLSGTGAGAWFHIEQDSGHFRIIRYSPKGTVHSDALYSVDQSGFELEQSFEFLHGSNSAVCIIKQNDFLFNFRVL